MEYLFVSSENIPAWLSKSGLLGTQASEGVDICLVGSMVAIEGFVIACWLNYRFAVGIQNVLKVLFDCLIWR